MKQYLTFCMIGLMLLITSACQTSVFDDTNTLANSQEDFTERFEALQEQVKNSALNTIEGKEDEPEFSFWPTEPQNKMREAVVTRVIDGDTIVIDSGERVRFIGMDTPELRDREGNYNPEPFAEEAIEFVREILEGKTIFLEYYPDHLYDPYDRLLAYVWLEGDNMLGMVNALLLHEGLATVMTIPPHTTYASIFEQIEQDAKRRGVGMWAN